MGGRYSGHPTMSVDGGILRSAATIATHAGYPCPLISRISFPSEGAAAISVAAVAIMAMSCLMSSLPVNTGATAIARDLHVAKCAYTCVRYARAWSRKLFVAWSVSQKRHIWPRVGLAEPAPLAADRVVDLHAAR